MMKQRYGQPVGILALLLALTAASCGLRVPSQGTSLGPATGGSTPTNEEPLPSDTPPSSDADPGDGGSSDGGSSDSGADQAQGITKDTITIGILTAVTGPATVLTGPMKRGYEAAIRAVNSRGGIGGRKIIVVWKDTQGNGSLYAEAARDLVENKKVFTLSAGELAHQAGAAYLASKEMPVIGGESAAPVWFQNPMFFPLGNQYNGTAAMADWAVKEGKVKAVALMSVNLSVSQEGCNAAKQQLVKLGKPPVYEASVPLGQPDLSTYVTQARAKGADAILQCFDNATSVALMKTLEKQKWHPYVGAASGAADDDLLRSASPELLEGMVVNFPLPSWTDTSVPAVVQYVRDFDAVNGKGARNSNFAMRAYVSIMLLKAAVEGVGQNPTRQKVVQWLNRKDKFTFGGLLPPDTSYLPDERGNHAESNCSQHYEIRGGKWKSASNGWVCLKTG